jgi:flagellar motor switch/type III secretory pathway protein FliN
MSDFDAFDDGDFEAVDFEQNFEDAVIPSTGGNYNLELRALYYLHGELAQMLAQLQEDYITFPQTQWQVTSVEVKPFKEQGDRYGQNAFWGILDFVDQPGGAFLFLDLPAAEMVTGLGEEELSGDDGQGYVETWMNHVGTMFQTCWQDIAAFDVQIFSSPTAPSLVELQSMFPGLNQNTPMLLTAFRVTQPGQSAVARVVLGIPQAYMLAVGQSLQAIGQEKSSPSDTTYFYERLAYVEDVPVSVTVTLGKSEMSVGELQNLEEGDIIELDTTVGLPLEVKVGSMSMRGKPGTTTDGRRLAVQLVVGLGADGGAPDEMMEYEEQ